MAIFNNLLSVSEQGELRDIVQLTQGWLIVSVVSFKAHGYAEHRTVYTAYNYPYLSSCTQLSAYARISSLKS